MPVPPHDQLQAVVRRLTTTQREGEEMRLLTAERRYPATREEVWDALTDPERVPRWLGGAVTGDLEVGGRYQVEGNAGGEVLACAPPRSFSITWEFDGHLSWVDVTLTAAGDRTRLLLEHTAPVDPDRWEQFGPGAVGIGWEMALWGLDEHLRSPQADPEELPRWLASPEGRAYLAEVMTLCSERWVEASINAGTEPQAARAAGRRCTEAYTAPAPD